MISVYLEYDSNMGEVHRVFDALAQELGDRAEVWVDPDDAIAGRVDSGYEPAKGRAVVDVDASSRAEAHDLIAVALTNIDPNGDVVSGGDVVLAQPQVWRRQTHG